MEMFLDKASEATLDSTSIQEIQANIQIQKHKNYDEDNVKGGQEIRRKQSNTFIDERSENAIR